MKKELKEALEYIKDNFETPEQNKDIAGMETPEQKQLKNIAIALKGIQKELEHLNRTLRK